MSLIPATDDRAAERKRFHTWCEERGVDCTLWMPNQPWCGYSNSRTQDYWEGWCARADADGVNHLPGSQPDHFPEVGKMIKKEADGDGVRPCPECHGTGQWQSACQEMRNCEKCDGRGTIGVEEKKNG